MSDTINNVSRELKPCPFCGSEAGRATKKATWNLSRHRVACTNSGCGAHYGYWHPIEWNTRAPSPAGVDGLEVVAWQTNREGDSTFPRLHKTEGGAQKWVEFCNSGPRITKEPLSRTNQAAYIINSLRGEIERIGSAYKEMGPWRDSAAQRIGELEGLLRDSAELIKHGVFEDGYCCCGSSVDSHGLGDGHSPVDALAYHAGQVCERIDAALSAGKDSD